VAEELVLDDMTTGASDDIRKATGQARRMVTEYGMSDALGPLTLGQARHEVFLGRDFAANPDYSDQLAFEIDTEVRRLIDEAHDEALEILQKERTKLDEIAAALIERETLEGQDLAAILDGIRKRSARNGQKKGAGVAVARRSVRASKDKRGRIR
jgi:cell division protease FtsH